jgi:tRNA dimethylallyltransferase
MVEQGMENEARSLYGLRHLNSLNTVGFKEWFAHFDGELDRETTISRIAKNTRVYAKKQLTWLKRDDSVIWLPSSNPFQAIKKFID